VGGAADRHVEPRFLSLLKLRPNELLLALWPLDTQVGMTCVKSAAARSSRVAELLVDLATVSPLCDARPGCHAPWSMELPCVWDFS